MDEGLVDVHATSPSATRTVLHACLIKHYYGAGCGCREGYRARAGGARDGSIERGSAATSDTRAPCRAKHRTWPNDCWVGTVYLCADGGAESGSSLAFTLPHAATAVERDTVLRRCTAADAQAGREEKRW